MIYSIQELKNMITDRIHENHERAIDGVDLQEFLHDILDSLSTYTDEKVVSPAINYYVNLALFNANTGALTLARAGGITPANISVDLDGRYQLLSSSPVRSTTILLNAGTSTITFIKPFPNGTIYTVSPLPGHTSDDDYIWGRLVPGSQTVDGFQITFDRPVTYTYVATIET
jgi:hypothetical protein